MDKFRFIEKGIWKFRYFMLVIIFLLLLSFIFLLLLAMQKMYFVLHGIDGIQEFHVLL